MKELLSHTTRRLIPALLSKLFLVVSLALSPINPAFDSDNPALFKSLENHQAILLGNETLSGVRLIPLRESHSEQGFGIIAELSFSVSIQSLKILSEEGRFNVRYLRKPHNTLANPPPLG